MGAREATEEEQDAQEETVPETTEVPGLTDQETRVENTEEPAEETVPVVTEEASVPDETVESTESVDAPEAATVPEQVSVSEETYPAAEDEEIHIFGNSHIDETAAAEGIPVIALLLHRKVDHGVYSRHNIRTVVVEPLGREFQIEGARHVGRFYLLTLAVSRVQFAENHLLLAKMERRHKTQCQMVVYSKVGKHTDTESGIICRHISIPLLTAGCNKAIVCKFKVLIVKTEKESVMQTAKIYIRPILHLTLLSGKCKRDYDQRYYE